MHNSTKFSQKDVARFTTFHPLDSYFNMKLTYDCNFQYGTVEGVEGALGKPYLT